MAKRSDRIQWVQGYFFTDGSPFLEENYAGFQYVTEAGIPVDVTPAELPWNPDRIYSLLVNDVAPAFGPHSFTVRIKSNMGIFSDWSPTANFTVEDDRVPVAPDQPVVVTPP
jgi:hypothetical protein